MRALLGILILGGLFLAAASWQRRHTQDLREQRRVQHGLPEESTRTRSEAGWSLLVVGRPSGAPSLLTDPGGAPEPTDPRPEGTAGGEDPQAPSFAPDYLYVVRQGDSLGVICQKHYGTARKSLVEAVARYNGLGSPDSVRAGATLLLPDSALLGQ